MVDGTDDQIKEIETRIKELEDTKSEMINRIRYLIRRVRIKKYEQKAIEPFLEQTKDVEIAPLRRRRNKMEFMIATAAYTPRMEREWLKEVRKLDEQLDKVREVERARRKRVFVERDIKEGEEEIKRIEKSLKDTRDSLRKLYDEAKSVRMAAKRSVSAAMMAEEDMVSLGDLAMMDKRESKRE